MQKFAALSLLLFVGCSSLINQQKVQSSNYQYSIDLQSIQDDKLSVTLITPKIESDQILFHLPKMVPGTYSVYDFGRFAADLKAFDATGKELAVEKTDANSWKISSARQLYKVTYVVDDTYDSESKPAVFEPAGTSFDSDRDFVMINTHTMFGYFEGMKSNDFEISVTKPTSFYGATSLIAKRSTSKEDVFYLDTYMDLVDSPILYSEPDTTTTRVGNADVLVSVVSPNGKVKAKFVSENVSDILFAAKNYFGGRLPIDKYAFLIVLEDKETNSGGFGALEHSYSSAFYLPETEPQQIAKTVRDVAAHEFYHIVTPLNIHSEEIGNFDYQNPKMSKHLWLYEGVTEYTAHYVQLREGLITLDEFMAEMKDKITNSLDRYNDKLPFTELSLGALDQHSHQYTNVYQKGALIGLILDLKLRELSNGKTGLKDVIAKLAVKYPKHVSFKDSELFDEITGMTYPEIRSFFTRFVEGSEPLSFKDAFASIGYEYIPKYQETEFSFGGVTMRVDFSNGSIVVDSDSTMNEFGKMMGYKTGDVLKEFNGKPIELRSFRATRTAFIAHAKEGDEMSVGVVRNGENVTLKAKMKKVSVDKFHKITPMQNPTEMQLKVRNGWLGK